MNTHFPILDPQVKQAKENLEAQCAYEPPPAPRRAQRVVAVLALLFLGVGFLGLGLAELARSQSVQTLLGSLSSLLTGALFTFFAIL